MNTRSQLDPTAARSTFAIQYDRIPSHATLDQYLDGLVDEYKRGCELSDLTCKRKARIALCREVGQRIGYRLTYRQAVVLLG